MCILAVMVEYTLAELAEAAGLSARTVRYYMAEGLLPSPIGSGKKAHYDDSHLTALEQIKDLKKLGYSLDQIRQMTTEARETITVSGAQWYPDEMWEMYRVHPDVTVSFRVPMSPDRKQELLRKIERFTEPCPEKETENGN